MTIRSRLRSRFKTRKNVKKWTFAIHLLFGLFLAAIPAAFIYLARILSVSPIPMLAIGIFLALALLAFFAWDEWWDDRCNSTNQGESDWWTAFMAFVVGIVAFIIVFVVHGVTNGIGFW
jgi:hypothetical protein